MVVRFVAGAVAVVPLAGVPAVRGLRAHACVLGLVVLAHAGAVQAGAPAETIGSYLSRLQEESAAPFVQYCGGRFPNLRRPLEREYSRFRKTFRRATAPLIAQIGRGDELAKPVPPGLRAQFESLRVEDMARVSRLDPLEFCQTLRQDLSAATAESIRRNMESAFAQYRVAARQGR